jgi:hypothetical protein
MRRKFVADTSSRHADPDRVAFIETTRVPSSLDDVVAAIATYTEHAGAAYVERFGERWRWSPAHQGGAYPLLRIVARFLRIDHHRIMVPFRTVLDGWAVLRPDEETDRVPDAAAVLVFVGRADAGDVLKRLAQLP